MTPAQAIIDIRKKQRGRPILQLTIFPDGKLFATYGNDNDNSDDVEIGILESGNLSNFLIVRLPEPSIFK